ncbi:NAD(P)-binding protein [Cadophora sp. DSE1049]|nr:NAD(P)-binding protein [Cadophora sp. DSE1049]
MAPLVWLITGASSGLGLALAKGVLARGDQVIATARNISSPALLELQDRLTPYRQAGVSLLELDVTASSAAISEIVASALAVYGHINILVNNAGYLEIGVLEDLEDTQWVAQFETSVFGAIKLAKAILPSMRARSSGTVVWVGSVAGWKGDAEGGAYCASKFALAGIAESFREEVAHLGIKSLLVEPGYCMSLSFTLPFLSSSRSTDNDKGLHAAMTAYNGHQPGDPSKAAERIIDAVKSEGMAEGATYQRGLEKCEATLEMLKEWEGVSVSTDF